MLFIMFTIQKIMYFLLAKISYQSDIAKCVQNSTFTDFKSFDLYKTTLVSKESSW